MLQVGVLASHQGTNFQALLDACQAGRLHAEVVLLICNNSTAPVIQRAESAGVPAIHLSSSTHPDPEALDIAILKALEGAQTDLVLLAGYMKKLGTQTLAAYRDRIINVHPSLLPRHGGKGMYGMHVHAAVIASGDRETGATVHQVVGEYDRGEILLQEKIPLRKTDTPETLATQVHKLEHDMLIRAIHDLQSGIETCRKSPR